jgi:hypothetical protein
VRRYDPPRVFAPQLFSLPVYAASAQSAEDVVRAVDCAGNNKPPKARCCTVLGTCTAARGFTFGFAVAIVANEEKIPTAVAVGAVESFDIAEYGGFEFRCCCFCFCFAETEEWEWDAGCG